MPTVLAAVDKFRGTATAAEAAAAVAVGATDAGWSCDAAPLSDGGEGLLEVFGGANRSTRVTGPLGSPVEAAWRLEGGSAVIESAQACGLEAAGGAEGNDPMGATTAGVGELLIAALDAGARRIVVGLGGSATTDGGLGALRAGPRPARLRGVELIAACDVTTSFVDAARLFAPQKGATPAQAALLERRLAALLEGYRVDYGVDLEGLEGAGAAGGLAGGLVVLGARIGRGIDAVADALDLDDRLDAADAVVTGEGFLDGASFAGKVVGGVLERAMWTGTPALVIAGDADDEGRAAAMDCSPAAVVVSLTERYGVVAARSDTVSLLQAEVARFITALPPRPAR